MALVDGRCGSTTTRDGHRCRHPVDGSSTRCAAGHRVTPSMLSPTKSSQPVISVGVSMELDDLVFGDDAGSVTMSGGPVNFTDDEVGGGPVSIDALLELLGSEDARRVLDGDEGTRGCGWTSGGCYALALALESLIPDSTICTLCEEENEPFHYVVRIPDGRYLDGSGVFSKEELVKTYSGDVGGFRFHETECCSEIPGEAVSYDLEMFLRQRLLGGS